MELQLVFIYLFCFTPFKRGNSCKHKLGHTTTKKNKLKDEGDCTLHTLA